jgi:hypothetical protein
MNIMNTKKHLLIAILIAFASVQAFSQGAGRRLYPGASKARSNASAPISRKLAYPWTLTLGTGYTSIFGQQKDYFSGFAPSDFQINLGVRYRFTTRFTLAGGIKYFSLSGNDITSSREGFAGRGIVSKTSCLEAQLIGMFDIIPIITRFMGDKTDQYNRRNFFVPYVFGGVGLLSFDPKFKNPISGENVSVSNLRISADKTGKVTKGIGTLVPTATLGLGFRVKISEFVDLGADLSYTSTFSDYLDGISGGTYYYNADSLNKISPLTSDEIVLSDPGFYAKNTNLTIPNVNDVGRTPTGEIKVKDGGSGKDGYFTFNIRVDYTLSSLKNIGKQKAHRHFQKGKGTYHHKFKRK